MYRAADDLPLVLTEREVREALRVSRNTAYEIMHASDFPSFTVGNRLLRVRKEDFLKWTADQKLSKET